MQGIGLSGVALAWRFVALPNSALASINICKIEYSSVTLGNAIDQLDLFYNLVRIRKAKKTTMR